MGDYFQSYEDFEVHKLMLEDAPRNEAYRRAIFDNRDFIRGKTVMDIGAGTGILSVFCAQAGAALVYAIEASDTYKVAEEIVEENGFKDIIHVIHSRVEDFFLPSEAGKVDVIVSEWMGHFLLHEGMLSSVVLARDKFLRPGGLIFPENATLYSAPCSVPYYYDYWTNVSGISMKTFAKTLRTQTCKTPKIVSVSPQDILTDAEILLWIDLREVTLDDLKSATIRHMAVATKNGKYQGICLWFSCSFPADEMEPVVLTTEPGETETHWKQTVIVLPDEADVETGMPLPYDIKIFRNERDWRKYCLEVEMLDADSVEHPLHCGCYHTKCLLARAVLEKYEGQEPFDGLK